MEVEKEVSRATGGQLWFARAVTSGLSGTLCVPVLYNFKAVLFVSVGILGKFVICCWVCVSVLLFNKASLKRVCFPKRHCLR